MAASSSASADTSARESSRRRIRYAAGNIVLALTFFVAAVPHAVKFGGSFANIVWMAGSFAMGVFSLVRFSPRVVMLDARALTATVITVVLPYLIRPAPPSSGIIASCALGLEIFGVVLSQVARLYLGRRFGVLPANRGIVSSGPFRFVRHPIYVGWFFLTLGYASAYPSIANFAILLVMTPFVLWRVRLEEELLSDDPEYREYQRRVRYMLVPGLI